MQLDNITIQRSYYYVICTNTTQRQEQDHLKVEESIAQWPHEDVTYQYLLNNLLLKQQRDTDKIPRIKLFGLNIRKNAAAYMSETMYKKHLIETRTHEVFMAQDVQRWQNQNFAVTVYRPDAS